MQHTCLFLFNCYISVPSEDDDDEITTLESLQLSFETVRVATNDFADSNKLGESGFGAVYKVR